MGSKYKAWMPHRHRHASTCQPKNCEGTLSEYTFVIAGHPKYESTTATSSDKAQKNIRARINKLRGLQPWVKVDMKLIQKADVSHATPVSA